MGIEVSNYWKLFTRHLKRDYPNWDIREGIPNDIRGYLDEHQEDRRDDHLWINTYVRGMRPHLDEYAVMYPPTHELPLQVDIGVLLIWRYVSSEHVSFEHVIDLAASIGRWGHRRFYPTWDVNELDGTEENKRPFTSTHTNLVGISELGELDEGHSGSVHEVLFQGVVYPDKDIDSLGGAEYVTLFPDLIVTPELLSLYINGALKWERHTS